MLTHQLLAVPIPKWTEAQCPGLSILFQPRHLHHNVAAEQRNGKKQIHLATICQSHDCRKAPSTLTQPRRFCCIESLGKTWSISQVEPRKLIFPGSFLQKTMVLLIQAHRANFWPLFVAPSVERLDLLLLGIHGLCLRHHNLLRRNPPGGTATATVYFDMKQWGPNSELCDIICKSWFGKWNLYDKYIYIYCNLHLHVVCGWNWVYSLAWRLSRPNCIRKWRSKNDAFPDVECLCERIHDGTPRQYESRVSQHPSAIDVAATLKIPLDFIQYSPFSVTSRIVTHKKRQKGVLAAQKQKERHSTKGPISSQTLILVCVCVCTSWIFISNTGSFMSCGFPLE